MPLYWSHGSHVSSVCCTVLNETDRSAGTGALANRRTFMDLLASEVLTYLDLGELYKVTIASGFVIDEFLHPRRPFSYGRY